MIMMKLIKMLSLVLGTAFAFNLPTLVLSELGSVIRRTMDAIAQSAVDLQAAGLTPDSGVTGMLLFCASQLMLWRIRRGAQTLKASAVLVAAPAIFTASSAKKLQ